jgi:hypothetical protein
MHANTLKSYRLKVPRRVKKPLVLASDVVKCIGYQPEDEVVDSVHLANERIQ